MISQWRLPAELGGQVVNPRKVLRGECVGQYELTVPGTAWKIMVPGECLVPMVPEEPPVNSVLLVLGNPGRTWQLFVRQSTGVPARPGRWSAPGGSGVVHTWQGIHESWDQVHVLVWWDADEAGEGAAFDSAGLGAGLAITEAEDDEPGLVTLRRRDGRGISEHLDGREAIRAAAALLGLALKERM